LLGASRSRPSSNASFYRIAENVNGQILPEWSREIRTLSQTEAPEGFGQHFRQDGGAWKGKKLAGPKAGCSPECREEAVKPLIETSRPIAKVAKELVINAGNLSNWVKAYPRKDAEKEPRLKEQECEIQGSVWKLGVPKELA
jgi:hypothetical protein